MCDVSPMKHICVFVSLLAPMCSSVLYLQHTFCTHDTHMILTTHTLHSRHTHRSYRGLYLLNWIYRYCTEPGYRQWIGVFACKQVGCCWVYVCITLYVQVAVERCMSTHCCTHVFPFSFTCCPRQATNLSTHPLHSVVGRDSADCIVWGFLLLLF